MKDNVEFHPTLVIGLGGTGHGVLLKLKKRLIDQFGYVPPIIKFLAIDTTQEAERILHTFESKEPVELEPKDEQCIIRVKDPSSLLGSKNPHIDKWWTTGTRVSAIVSGAQQIRALGRLALFANYEEIKSRITQKLDEVRQVESMNKMQQEGRTVSEKHGVEIYIVSSLAGGTGSGIFLDIAFIARNIVSTSNITGLFVLPKVFAKLPGTELVKTNTYAALKEIEKFSKLTDEDREIINYGINEVVVKKPPFDLVYIIDSINEAEKIIDSHKQLHSQIADGLYLLIGSEMGVGSSNAIDNIKTHLATAGLVEERSTSYCSFGVASCTWDSESYKRKYESLQKESSQKLVDDILKLHANSEDIDASVYKFNQTYYLFDDNTEPFLQQLNKQGSNAGMGTFKSQINAMAFNRNSLIEIRNRHERYLRNVESQINRDLRINYKQLKEQFSAGFQEWQEKSLARTDFLDYMKEVLKRLVDKIDRMKEAVQLQLDQSDSRLDDIPANFKEKEESISAASKAYFKKAKKIKTACINYAGAVDMQRELIFRKEACRLASDLLSEYRIEIDKILQECRHFKTVLNRLLEDMAAGNTDAADNTAREHNPFESLLPCPAPALGTRNTSDFIGWCNEKFGSLAALMKKPLNDVKDDIHSYIASRSGPAAEMTIDEVIKAELRNPKNVDLESRLNYLSQLAAPLWFYNDGEIPLTRKTVSKMAYCGVSNGDNPLIKNLKSGWLGGTPPTLIKTIDPNRITFFNISFGIPLFALNGIKEMEEEYYSKRTGSCHLHRDWQKFPDIIPKRLGNPLSCFAIAQASGFELIQVVSDDYTIYLSQNGGKRREVSLGKDPEHAFRTFEEKQDDFEAVKQAILEIVNNQDKQVITNNLTHQKDNLSNLISKNGLNELNKKFVKKQIGAIEDFIKIHLR